MYHEKTKASSVLTRQPLPSLKATVVYRPRALSTGNLGIQKCSCACLHTPIPPYSVVGCYTRPSASCFLHLAGDVSHRVLHVSSVRGDSISVCEAVPAELSPPLDPEVLAHFCHDKHTVVSRRWAGRLWVGQSALHRPPPLSERPFALNASPQQEERPIRQILYLGDLLETCHFQAFWVTCLGPRGRVVTGPCRKSCWKLRPCTFIGFFRGSGPCVQNSAWGMAQNGHPHLELGHPGPLLC